MNELSFVGNQVAGRVRVESNPAAGSRTGVVRYRRPTAADAVVADRDVAHNIKRIAR